MESISRRAFVLLPGATALALTGCVSPQTQDRFYYCDPIIHDQLPFVCRQIAVAATVGFTLANYIGYVLGSLIGMPLRSRSVALPNRLTTSSATVAYIGGSGITQEPHLLHRHAQQDREIAVAVRDDLSMLESHANRIESSGSTSQRLELRRAATIVRPVARLNINTLRITGRNYLPILNDVPNADSARVVESSEAISSLTRESDAFMRRWQF